MKRLSMRLLAAAALTAAGCVPPGPSSPVVKLHGSVTVGETPVQSGTLIFSPETGTPGGPVHAPVVGGAYDVTVAKGKHRVSFAPGEPAGGDPPSSESGKAKTVNGVPQKYRDGVPFELVMDKTFDIDLSK